MEINVNLDTDDTSLTLSQAILLYGINSREGSKTQFATIHDVEVVQHRKGATQQIMPGKPLSKAGILATLGSIANEFAGGVTLYPEHLLSSSPQHLVWWRPAQKTRIFFNNTELGNRSRVLHQPALLFSISGGVWSVWALKKSERPTEATTLYRAPYFNVYESADICVGSAELPSSIAPDSIGKWEEGFFSSSFTHVNGGKKRVEFQYGDYGFWKQMLDGAFEKQFPVEVLIDEKLTVGNVLTRIRNLQEQRHGQA